MIKRVLLPVAILSLLIGMYWGADVLGDRTYRAEVDTPASLYSLPPYEYPAVNPVVATLVPSQSIQVLRVRHGKDFETLKVETPSGQVGWVIVGEGIKVISRVN